MKTFLKEPEPVRVLRARNPISSLAGWFCLAIAILPLAARAQVLFTDSFTRTNLSPWIAYLSSPSWTVTGTAMQAGPDNLDSYGFAYITNIWTNYSVQAQIQFSVTNAFGGGIGGRYNPATGQHYAAWLYPEGSPVGGNVLKLIKFDSLTGFGYNSLNNGAEMAHTNLSANVGTNVHTIKLSFVGNQISVAYDGVTGISMVDVDAAAAPYTNGSISLDRWTDALTYTMSVDNVEVDALAVVPVANNDSYFANQGTTLSVAAPGVLANDTDADGKTLAAVSASTPAHGTLNLNTNGGFTYTATAGYTGPDSFTYSASDGSTNSTPATVSLWVSAAGTLFSDSFTRLTLPPWTAYLNSPTWSVTGAAMQAGPDSLQTYGFAYITNAWTNYSVQAQVQFSTTNAFGGGVGGRYNPATGQHYGAWIYPEGSTGGSSVLRLIKFTGFTTFVYNGVNSVEMTHASLPGVGTNAHSVKLAFSGNQIAVYYDGTEVISMADTDTGGAPFGSGSVSLDHWTDAVSYTMLVDNLTVNLLANNDSYSVNQGTNLTVAAPGVLTNDTEVYGGNLTAAVVTGPANGVLNLNTNGGFTYTPTASYSGPDSFTYVANDGATNVGTATVNLTVVHVGPTSQVFFENFDSVTAPALPAGWTTTSSGVETNWVTQTNIADSQPNSVFCPDVSNIGNSELVSPAIAIPTGDSQLTFRQSYVFETGTGTDGFDGGVLEIKIGAGAFTDIIAAGGSFLGGGYNSVIDTKFQNPLAGRSAWSGNSGGFITTTMDLPPAAVGQTIQLKWRGGTDNGNGAAGWNVDTIAITNCNSHGCWNTAPMLAAQTNQTVNELTTLTVTNIATDSDLPPNNLRFSLLSPPTGATINTNTGVFTWAPSEAQGPGTNVITVVVTDNGSPPLSATNSFTVFVMEVNTAPVLPVQNNRTNAGLAKLTVTNTATDSDIPANPLSYVLTTSPTGATITTNTGIITWTPVASQVPSTNTFTTVVTDSSPLAVNSQHLSATNSFVVVVAAVHNGPSLPAQTTRTNNELTLITVTNTATDNDIPTNALTYALTVFPTGATIATNTGIITWTPTEAQGPGTYTITTVVTDNGTPNLSATNSFTVVVNEVNTAPVLPVQSSRTNNELTLLTVTNTATDSDLPPNNLTYALTVFPAGAVINTNTGVITWTPQQNQSPSTNTITTVVNDNGSPNLFATNSFTVTVKEVNLAPSLGVISNQSVSELVKLIVTNTATESNIHSATIGYGLINPPVGAVIDTNGVITWTPQQNQSPGTNLFTTVVTNNNPFDAANPSLTATNSFTVTVKEANVAPTLGAVDPQTVNELVKLTVTNAATELNVHSVTTGYGLVSPPTGAVIDTNGVVTWTPQQNQSPGNYTITTVVTNANPFDAVNPSLTATNQFTVAVKEVNVAPVLAVIGPQAVNELAPLLVTNAAAEPNIHSATAGYGLVNSPTGATIDTNGVITWTPQQNQSPGNYTITTVVTNANPFDAVNPSLTATNSFNVTVKEVNVAPVLAVIGPQTVNELVPLTVTNAAAEPNIHSVTTGYGLVSPPTGAVIDTNGVITWTPQPSQSPGSYTITTVVTNANPFDAVNPSLTATNQFAVAVKEVNVAPLLAVIGPQVVNELAPLTVTNAATEPNIHSVTTGYGLVNPPTGAAIDTNGVITWTPQPSQSPGSYTITTVVTNANAFDAASPTLTATNSFNVTVKEVNLAPLLGVVGPQTVNELVPLTVTNAATEPNIHSVTTGYGLVNPPAGAAIDTNGVITWTPQQSQSPGSYNITTVVTNANSFDTVNPSLAATNSFNVTVKEVNIAPQFGVIAPQTLNELIPLTVTNAATEPNIHSVTTGYGLVNPPAGAAIDTNGVITWTPQQSQSPGSYTITTVVTNANSFDTVNPSLTATNSFNVTVKEVNVAPLMGVVGPQTVNELVPMTLTNAAAEPNTHSVTVGYGLVSAPAGMAVDTNGVITWTPQQNQSPGTNTIVTVVTNSNPFDSVNPSLTATNSFTLVVREVNVAPSLGIIGQQTVNELVQLTVTNAATETNIHSVTTGYGLVNPPGGATIDANGVIRWTPTLLHGPGPFTITTVVTNSNPFDLVNPSLTATNSFVVITLAPMIAPSIGSITVSNGTVVITWASVPGSTYQVQHQDTINGTNWSDAPGGILATSTNTSATNAIGGAPQQFYRVHVLP